MHAEPVLLVHDHEGEAAELDAFLEQRVRADRHLDVARRKLALERGARLARVPAGQQRDAHAERVEPAP